MGRCLDVDRLGRRYKTVRNYLVGGRSADWSIDFMKDAASRILGRVQITTDGHRAYLEAVEEAFGADVDYAQLQKIYGAPAENDTRYSTRYLHRVRDENRKRRS